MNKLMTTSIIAGSMLGAAGMVMMSQDKRTQKKMMRNGKKFVTKASDVIEDMTNMVK